MKKAAGFMDPSVNPVSLSFVDEKVERNFIREYDTNNQVFYRVGIYLSCFAWFIWYTGLYFSYRDIFSTALTVLVAVLGIPFVVVVTLSFFNKYSTINHHLAAFCNFSAACVCIYVAVYLSKDITFLCAGIVCIPFFCYFILRIRFKVSLAITLSYAVIAQVCVIRSGNFSYDQIYTSSSGIWLGFSMAMIAGYFFEKTNRKLFVQNQMIVKHTDELAQSLENLRTTQSQLIQSEKMASLGELTAGIAHEIQNPLNFVNNFSEVNGELIKELKSEIITGNLEEISALAQDIEANSEKITHHGKRADAIVKGMLQHSQSSSGKKEPTDINKLADEYLRLAYHGLRAKDNSFNATLKTDYDHNIGNIGIIPQDIGRVVLNLVNNAFYAVREKHKQNGKGYEPTVSVSTKKVPEKPDSYRVEVTVKDNGDGIPHTVLEKIFQPFFTTKPTGQGTGLGLSLSYDIVKAHGGELKVETKETEGSAFIIRLPMKDNA